MHTCVLRISGYKISMQNVFSSSCIYMNLLILRNNLFTGWNILSFIFIRPYTVAIYFWKKKEHKIVQFIRKKMINLLWLTLCWDSSFLTQDKMYLQFVARHQNFISCLVSWHEWQHMFSAFIKISHFHNISSKCFILWATQQMFLAWHRSARVCKSSLKINTFSCQH